MRFARVPHSASGAIFSREEKAYIRAMPGYTLFPTPLGACGIAWNERGVAALQLPEPDEARTRARLLRRAPGAEEASPPPAVEQAIADILALLGGQPNDLMNVQLDMDGVPDLNRRVYEVARAIPPGETLTYGEVAARIGEPGMAQAVGQALGHNPFPIVVPCHRVVAADGEMHGFSAAGGVATKRKMLAMEGSSLKGATLFE